jgi:hypothetical protein
VTKGTYQAGKLQSAIKHRRWVRETRPSPESQSRNHVKVLLKDAIEDQSLYLDQSHSRTPLQEKLAVFNGDFRQELMVNNWPEVLGSDVLVLGLMQTDYTDPGRHN